MPVLVGRMVNKLLAMSCTQFALSVCCSELLLYELGWKRVLARLWGSGCFRNTLEHLGSWSRFKTPRRFLCWCITLGRRFQLLSSSEGRAFIDLNFVFHLRILLTKEEKSLTSCANMSLLSANFIMIIR